MVKGHNSRIPDEFSMDEMRMALERWYRLVLYTNNVRAFVGRFFSNAAPSPPPFGHALITSRLVTGLANSSSKIPLLSYTRNSASKLASAYSDSYIKIPRFSCDHLSQELSNLFS
jgi:hypothetical protein